MDKLKMKPCIFCDIANNITNSFKVWEDENFFAFLDITPINPGHILVISKIHYEDVYDMPSSLYTGLFIAIKRLSPTLKKVTSAKRIGLAIEGFGVAHVHVHLVPVNKGNELNPERARHLPEKELQEMQKALIDAFENLK
jgi:histidine triad (HIT) family protein